LYRNILYGRRKAIQGKSDIAATRQNAAQIAANFARSGLFSTLVLRICVAQASSVGWATPLVVPLYAAALSGTTSGVAQWWLHRCSNEAECKTVTHTSRIVVRCMHVTGPTTGSLIVLVGTVENGAFRSSGGTGRLCVLLNCVAVLSKFHIPYGPLAVD